MMIENNILLEETKTKEEHLYDPTLRAREEFLKTISNLNIEKKNIIISALNFAVKNHENQWYDWENGKKIHYTYHLLKVAINVQKFSKTIPAIITALWHDLLEDTDVSVKEISEFLKKHKLSEQIIFLLQSLNRKNFDTSLDYYQKILQDNISLSVKTADLISNLEASHNRLQEMLSNETRFWFYKYLTEIKQILIPNIPRKNLIFEELEKISSQITSQLTPNQLKELEEYSSELKCQNK